MKIFRESFVLLKQLVTLQASREVYFLFVVAKIVSFSIGVIVGRGLL